MTSLATIQEIGHRIGVQFKPQQVILFGSHAEGRAHSGSDVDLLVVMPTNRDPIDESVAIRMAVRPPFPVDLQAEIVEQFRNDWSELAKFLGSTDKPEYTDGVGNYVS